MTRPRRSPPLRVLANNRLVGRLQREAGGASFQYDAQWLAWEHAAPVSLSLPLRTEPWRGDPVAAVLENLLPDAGDARQRIARAVGASGADPYSLLAEIGRDCIGALQFVADDADSVPDSTAIDGTPVSDAEIAALLGGLDRAPLGLGRDEDFRISLAGIQSKTALLRHEGRWLKPHGATPTTHILKPQAGRLPNGLGLSRSVENEFYCLTLLRAFGLRVAAADMRDFDGTKALVVERFDRQRTGRGRLLRRLQEDCCQALSVPPWRKYQSDGGPGLAQLLGLLGGSDAPASDQKALLQAQLLFWLIAATDGHAKNFSVFLHPGGGFALAPLYDVLTMQPEVHAGRVRRNQVKLAMSTGASRHYRVETIRARHFLQTASEAGVPESLARSAIDEVRDAVDRAVARTASSMPQGFPEEIHAAVSAAVAQRLRLLEQVD